MAWARRSPGPVWWAVGPASDRTGTMGATRCGSSPMSRRASAFATRAGRSRPRSRRGSPMTDTPQTMRLADGRQLAWYEYGDAAGLPCVYTTGTPASGLAGSTYDKAAAEAGVRWISVDKPGYGHSDLQRGRTLLDWPADVRALADQLGLQRFAVAGESGG